MSGVGSLGPVALELDNYPGGFKTWGQAFYDVYTTHQGLTFLMGYSFELNTLFIRGGL